MTASTYGHIRSFHLPYLREFQHLGWETHVGCAGIPPDAPYADEAIGLPFEKKLRSPANYRAAKLLRERIASEGYDLVIAHTSLAAFFTRLALKGGGPAATISVCHGYLFDDDTPLLRRQVLLNAERLVAPQTDLLLTMNAWDFETAKKHRLAKQVRSIPGMGFDARRLDRATPEDGARSRRELGLSAQQFVLLCAAEFSARKSQHTLIEAMAKLPERAVLVLCGEGATLEDCRAMARGLDLGGRVRFPGHSDDMPAWYRMADAAVTASRSEGLPFNVMEAMHCGLPVVASAVKGHTDLIADGETGLLFPYGDADACAAQLRRVMDDAPLRKTLGTRGRASVGRYALDAVLPEVMERYLSVVPKAEPNL